MVGSFLAEAKLALGRVMGVRGPAPRQIDEWSDVAATLDLEIRVSSRGYPSLTGLVDLKPVFVGVRRDPKDKIEHTHYEVQFSSIGSTVTMSRKSNLSFLRNYEEGSADVEVGDHFFDETVVVDSGDAPFIREYLTPARRALVLEVFEHWINARITQNSIVGESIGFEPNGDRLIRTIERLVAIAYDLEQSAPTESPRLERRPPDLPASVAPPRVEPRPSDRAASAGPPRVEPRQPDLAASVAPAAPAPPAPVPAAPAPPAAVPVAPAPPAAVPVAPAPPAAVPAVAPVAGRRTPSVEPKREVAARPVVRPEPVDGNADDVTHKDPSAPVPSAPVPSAAVPLPPSLPLPPNRADDEVLPSAQQAVIDDLFEQHQGNDTVDWFDETYRDLEVAWSGEVIEAHTYRRDADFPGGPGVKVTVRLGGVGRSELVSNEVQAVLQLATGSNVSRGMTLSFVGVLGKVDRFARKLYVAEAEVMAL